jgi:hypothetical protein
MKIGKNQAGRTHPAPIREPGHLTTPIAADKVNGYEAH